MEKLSYKTFTWPHNPHTYRDRVVREPRFREENGYSVFSGLSPVKRTITGSGVFFGPKAYESYKALSALQGELTPGDLNHPVWGKCYCYLTELELTQEPKDDCVSYRFTFTGAMSNGEIPA